MQYQRYVGFSAQLIYLQMALAIDVILIFVLIIMLSLGDGGQYHVLLFYI